jgi:hypothetical protein
VAKKTRTPAPPRRVQAPKQRKDVRDGDEQKRWLTLILVAGLGFVGLIVVGALFAFGGPADAGNATEQLKAAGCTLQIADAERSGNHVTSPPKRSVYNTWPPTSGPHYPVPPPWGLYDEPVEQFRTVHNLEHGGVVVQYGKNVPQTDVDEIASWWRNDPNGIIVAPFPELADTITLAAWVSPEATGGESERGRGYLAKCTAFDKKAFDEFRDAYGFRGPESAQFPRDSLTPGN